MFEPDHALTLPTGGQMLGFVAHSLDLYNDVLNSKTTRRYFKGDTSSFRKDDSQTEIFHAFAVALAESGIITFGPDTFEDRDVVDTMAEILSGHASRWDETRMVLIRQNLTYERKGLEDMWTACLRLMIVDLSIRVAAYLLLNGISPSMLCEPVWAKKDAAIEYLKTIRESISGSPLTLNYIADRLGVSRNTVDSWMYENVRPADHNLHSLATLLTEFSGTANSDSILSSLRRFYGLRDIADAITDLIGRDRTIELSNRVYEYANRIYSLLQNRLGPQPDTGKLRDAVLHGAGSIVAPSILTKLVAEEADELWKQDIEWVGKSWIRRLTDVNLDTHMTDRESAVKKSNGRLLEDWGVSSPEAYERYHKAWALVNEGKYDRAIAELRVAIRLDPADAVNHYTLGSAIGALGTKLGNPNWVDEGLDECRIAIALDRKWLLPRTEIGWILIEDGRPSEALRHLESIDESCGPLDANYFSALAVARRDSGNLGDALDAFETAIELDPEDAVNIAAAAMCAFSVDNKQKGIHYAKLARHLGISEPYEFYRSGAFNVPS